MNVVVLIDANSTAPWRLGNEQIALTKKKEKERNN